MKTVCVCIRRVNLFLFEDNFTDGFRMSSGTSQAFNKVASECNCVRVAENYQGKWMSLGGFVRVPDADWPRPFLAQRMANNFFRLGVRDNVWVIRNQDIGCT